jgi:hypothetical protein
MEEESEESPTLEKDVLPILQHLIREGGREM